MKLVTLRNATDFRRLSDESETIRNFEYASWHATEVHRRIMPKQGGQLNARNIAVAIQTRSIHQPPLKIANETRNCAMQTRSNSSDQCVTFMSRNEFS